MYKQGEIVLVPFPYSDLSGSKLRPVLVVSNNDYDSSFPDIIVAVITSKTSKPDNYSIPLLAGDLELGFLPDASLIRIHKLFTIEKSRIVKRFSFVKMKKLDETLTLLGKLFQPILMFSRVLEIR